MNVLIDTNVLIDWIIHRKDHCENAKEIVYLCAGKKINGCIAAHSITNMFYILRKDLDFEKRSLIFSKFTQIYL